MRRVVVTGLGCISPIGNDIETFWRNAMAGKHGIANITRFDASDYKVRIAAEIKDFNAADHMERSEVRRTDLFVQYAMGAALQAVTESGIEGNIDPERFGAYVGSGVGGLNTLLSASGKLISEGPGRISPFFVPMMIANMASAHIAMRHNAKGANLPVVSACATGTHAIGEAFRAIKYAHADAIVTGGTESSINPLGLAGFTNCMALSTTNDPDNSSMPFDKRRDGFVMGEGAAIIVLEEYEHAIKRGAKIYCEVAGYGNTCDAYHITAPHPKAAESTRTITLALNEAEIKSYDKLYINPHGTSTPLNDKTETLAIKQALGDAAYNVPISSTKSLVGHMLGAAGGIEAIAAIKTIETGVIHPIVGYREPDPECDLDYVPNTAREVDIDCALSLSLGFGGHNASLAFKKV